MSELAKTSLISDSSLKAYWKLEDVSDSKNGFNLTNNNSVTFIGAKYSNGASFGSGNTNKSLSIANNLGIDGGACSISLWVRLLSEITTGSWTFCTQAATPSYVRNEIVYSYNSGTLRVSFSRVRENITADFNSYNIALGVNNWYHIVYTYDGSNIRGYFQGVLVAGPTASTGNGGSSAGTNKSVVGAGLQLGDTPGTIDSFSSSVIDDVAIFSKALSATEIATLFADSGNQGYIF